MEAVVYVVVNPSTKVKTNGVREFMLTITERGLETEVDRGSMTFAERMVLELQDTAYALLDRKQRPETFFARVRCMLHSAAIYFDWPRACSSLTTPCARLGKANCWA